MVLLPPLNFDIFSGLINGVWTLISYGLIGCGVVALGVVVMYVLFYWLIRGVSRITSGVGSKR